MDHDTRIRAAGFLRGAACTGAAVVLVLGCTTHAPAPVQTGASSSLPGGQASKAPSTISPSARTHEAAQPRTLADWKRSAAERIHAANRSQVYGGTPPILCGRLSSSK